MAILSWRTPLGPIISGNSGTTRVSARRERRRKKLRTALISRVLKLCSEKQLGRAIQRMLTLLQLYLKIMKLVSLDESWELQNTDLWIRPTDLSWHYPIFVTIGELPFKKKWKVDCEFGGQGWSWEAKYSVKSNRDTKWQSHFYGQWRLHIDFLGKGIHHDENNVCFWPTTAFHHFCHWTWWCDIWHPF